MQFSKCVSIHSAMWQIWDQWELCPCCGHNSEITHHMLICPDILIPHLPREPHSFWTLVVVYWLPYCLVQRLKIEQPALITPFASPTIHNAAIAQDHTGGPLSSWNSLPPYGHCSNICHWVTMHCCHLGNWLELSLTFSLCPMVDGCTKIMWIIQFWTRHMLLNTKSLVILPNSLPWVSKTCQ